MKNAHYIIFDVETGGLNPEKNPITQIALLTIDCKTLKEIDRFETFVKPYDDLVIEKIALDMTGLRMSDINNGIDKKQLVDVLSKYFKKNVPNTRPENRPILIGHNVQFDMGFLFYAFESCKKDLFSFVSDTQLDTMSLSKMSFPDATSLKLGKCAEKVGIRLPDAHKAMNDVIATTDLFRVYVKKLRKSEAKGQEETKEQKSRLQFQF